MMSDALTEDTDRCMVTCRDLRAKLYAGALSLDSHEYQELNFWHRTYIRTFITHVEGLLFVMRRIVAWAHDRGEVDLTPGEAVLIREKQYYFNSEKKRVEAKVKNNKLLENFVLAFDLFPRVFGSSFQVDYGNNGWEIFQSVVRVRNCLTHPKAPQDTLLQPELYHKISDAVTWFLSCLEGLFASVNADLLNQDSQKVATSPELGEFMTKWSKASSQKL
jgi:hypothetical protein